MHELISFVTSSNLSYNHRVSRIIEHLYLRGFLFGKMTVKEKPIEERKRSQYDLCFTKMTKSTNLMQQL
jgi:hypothetical protein